MRPRRPHLAFAALAPLIAAGCFAVGKGVLLPREEPDAGPVFIAPEDASVREPSLDGSGLLPLPHSVSSVDPAHGSFAGGERAIVEGTGFTSAVRVWFGDTEVPHTSVVPIDPRHAQVIVPAGSGLVDVSAQNADDASTRAVLRQGFAYDSFYLEPGAGPTSGGTIVTLYGDHTAWDPSTTVTIDRARCEVVAVRNPPNAPEELDCRTPPGTEGAKVVRVTAKSGATDVLDGFVYGDSNNGFRGGLSGNPLASELRVIALDNDTSRVLSHATVVLGSDATGNHVKTTDENGVLVVNSAEFGSHVTVTIAAHCYMPTTFVDVPVDTVTAYLDPVLSPDCESTNGHLTLIGGGGGSAVRGATITGDLVWPYGIEFRLGSWDVPLPNGESEDGGSPIRRAAYVFTLSSDLTDVFQLPAATSATTPFEVNAHGYPFSVHADVGTLTLYALAGVENRAVTPPLFTAYTLGIVQGVSALPGTTTKGVYIAMDIPLDHAFSIDVDGPTPTSRGPDRVNAQVGIRYGSLGYITLPVSSQTTLLPATAPLSFVGLPPLANELIDAEYVMTAHAATGASLSAPESVLGRYASTAPSGPAALNGFLQIPVLVVPSQNGSWDGRTLALDAAPNGPVPDLTYVEIESGGGLSTWTVAAPGTVTSVELPDLSAIDPSSEPVGPITITATFATIHAFTYGSLRYASLSSRGWNAYATNTFQTHR